MFEVFVSGQVSETVADDLNSMHPTYLDAVAAFNDACDTLAAAGWKIEHGWASQDNLSAAHATRGKQWANVQIVRADDNE